MKSLLLLLCSILPAHSAIINAIGAAEITNQSYFGTYTITPIAPSGEIFLNSTKYSHSGPPVSYMNVISDAGIWEFDLASVRALDGIQSATLSFRWGSSTVMSTSGSNFYVHTFSDNGVIEAADYDSPATPLVTLTSAFSNGPDSPIESASIDVTNAILSAVASSDPAFAVRFSIPSGVGSPGKNGYVGQVVLTVVPEPATTGFLLLGTAALAHRRRRPLRS